MLILWLILIAETALFGGALITLCTCTLVVLMKSSVTFLKRNVWLFKHFNTLFSNIHNLCCSYNERYASLQSHKTRGHIVFYIVNVKFQIENEKVEDFKVSRSHFQNLVFC
jgi:hypothetical protein